MNCRLYPFGLFAAAGVNWREVFIVVVVVVFVFTLLLFYIWWKFVFFIVSLISGIISIGNGEDLFWVDADSTRVSYPSAPRGNGLVSDRCSGASTVACCDGYVWVNVVHAGACVR